MELPIAPQTYQPSPQALARALLRSNLILARMAADETPLEGATALTNADRPRVRMVNCAMEVSVPEAMTAEQVLDAIDAHFQDHGLQCGGLYPANLWPDDMPAAIEARGYRPRRMNILLLTRFAPPPNPNDAVQIIPGRAAYPELRTLMHEDALSHARGDEALLSDLTQTLMDRLDEPRAEIFLGRINREPVGVVVLVTLGQIGVIDMVFTAAAARGQGVATALMKHTLEHCHRAQFEQVILEAPEGCPAVPLYERMGFRQAASFVQYERR